MTTLIFTICARNYIGLARVLEQSVVRHGHEIDFRIYVAEDVETDGDNTLRSAPRALQSIIGSTEYANMALVYNLTEFCTSLKAACFMHAFGDGYDRCIYMDPDIFVSADLTHITQELDDSAILITPHLCLPALTDGPRNDRGILATGIYNLGFLALRASDDTQRFLAWWHERLRTQAFSDHYSSLYTDQRWIDFVPALFPTHAVRIWRHLGCNVAPWNYHERRILQEREGFTVQPRHLQTECQPEVPLVFLHFSGFDFRRILDGQFDQLNLADAETFDDLLPLYQLYGHAISAMADEMMRHLSTPYGFDQFADGTLVLPSHRRLFRVWRDRHGDAAEPFGTGEGSFHAALKIRGLLGAGKADLIIDKVNSRTVVRPDRLMSRVHIVFRLIFRLMGRSRFFFLVRGLARLSHVEQHYDTFRIDDADISTAADQGVAAGQ